MNTNIDVYENAKIAPVLIKDIDKKILNEAVVIDSIIDSKDLGVVNTDKGIKYPKWYDEIVKLDYRILIIKDIDKIEEYEQEKFYELLKYKEISNFKLPKDLKIFVTYSNLDNVTDVIISLCQIIK